MSFPAHLLNSIWVVFDTTNSEFRKYWTFCAVNSTLNPNGLFHSWTMNYSSKIYSKLIAENETTSYDYTSNLCLNWDWSQFRLRTISFVSFTTHWINSTDTFVWHGRYNTFSCHISRLSPVWKELFEEILFLNYFRSFVRHEKTITVDIGAEVDRKLPMLGRFRPTESIAYACNNTFWNVWKYQYNDRWILIIIE